MGGGLFYIKPPKSINYNFLHSEDDYDVKVRSTRSAAYDPVPDIKQYHTTYEWVNALTNNHDNNTDVIFPSLKQGDVLIHNFTVWHAVAPIEQGTRYSLVLFFDTDNPMLDDNNDNKDNGIGNKNKNKITTTTKTDNIYDEVNHDDDYYDNDEDDDYDDELSEVQIKHEIIECVNGKIQYVRAIDIVWVNQYKETQYNQQNEQQLEQQQQQQQLDHQKYNDQILYLQTIQTNIRYNQIVLELTDEKQMFRAIRTKQYGTTSNNIVNVNEDPHQREVLAEIHIKQNKFTYTFKGINEEQILSECGSNNGNNNDNDNEEL